jgi:hypothetical protein
MQFEQEVEADAEIKSCLGFSTSSPLRLLCRMHIEQEVEADAEIKSCLGFRSEVMPHMMELKMSFVLLPKLKIVTLRSSTNCQEAATAKVAAEAEATE